MPAYSENARGKHPRRRSSARRSSRRTTGTSWVSCACVSSVAVRDGLSVCAKQRRTTRSATDQVGADRRLSAQRRAGMPTSWVCI